MRGNAETAMGAVMRSTIRTATDIIEHFFII